MNGKMKNTVAHKESVKSKSQKLNNLGVNNTAGRSRTIKQSWRKNEALSMIARPTASKTSRHSRGTMGAAGASARTIPRRRHPVFPRRHYTSNACYGHVPISLCHFSPEQGLSLKLDRAKGKSIAIRMRGQRVLLKHIPRLYLCSSFSTEKSLFWVVI